MSPRRRHRASGRRNVTASLTLLLAEGDIFNRGLLAQRVEKNLDTVIAAATSKEALHVLKPQNVDLVLLDIGLQRWVALTNFHHSLTRFLIVKSHNETLLKEKIAESLALRSYRLQQRENIGRRWERRRLNAVFGAAEPDIDEQ